MPHRGACAQDVPAGERSDEAAKYSAEQAGEGGYVFLHLCVLGCGSHYPHMPDVN